MKKIKSIILILSFFMTSFAHSNGGDFLARLAGELLLRLLIEAPIRILLNTSDPYQMRPIEHFREDEYTLVIEKERKTQSKDTCKLLRSNKYKPEMLNELIGDDKNTKLQRLAKIAHENGGNVFKFASQNTHLIVLNIYKCEENKKYLEQLKKEKAYQNRVKQEVKVKIGNSQKEVNNCSYVGQFHADSYNFVFINRLLSTNNMISKIKERAFLAGADTIFPKIEEIGDIGSFIVMNAYKCEKV